jgi:DNA-binding phage protein
MRKMGIWREYLIEKLADRERAIGYLQAILDDYQIDRSRTVVLRALQTVVEAQGGVSELAKQTDMDPQVLSKVLSNSDIPLIDALGTVLGALGYQLSIKPLTHENSNLKTDTDELKARNAGAHVAESPTSLQ